MEDYVSNAVRYTPAGGSISVRSYDEGATVAVEVADTGMGVSEQDRPHLFERFYRTEEAIALCEPDDVLVSLVSQVDQDIFKGRKALDIGYRLLVAPEPGL